MTHNTSPRSYRDYDWDNWYAMLDDHMQSFSSQIRTRTDTLKIKKMFNEVFEEEFFPCRIAISPLYEENKELFINHGSRYSISISPSLANTYFSTKEEIANLVRLMRRLPKYSEKLHSLWISGYIRDSISYIQNQRGRCQDVYEEVRKYLDGKITYDEVIANFFYDDKKREPNIGGKSLNEYSGGMSVGHYYQLSDLTLYKEALKKMIKTFVKTEVHEFIESMRDGKKLNKKFLVGLSDKPLLKKTTGGSRKPKVMIIHDCSGSMGRGKEGSPAHKAVSFIGALVNSGVVDVTHVINHSENGWRDNVKAYQKGELAHYYGGGDGFEYLDDNLPTELVKEVDYIIATTDLNYSEEGKKGLMEYMKRAKHHLVLSFSDEPSIPGLISRKVSTIKDMILSVTTILK